MPKRGREDLKQLYTDTMASSSEVASANPANGQALPPVAEDAFIADRDAADSGAEDEDDEDGKGKDGKKSGRRKIKIEFINDKSRRHITFSKRKAGEWQRHAS